LLPLIVEKPPSSHFIVVCEDDSFMLLGIADEVVEHLRTRRTAGNVVMDRHWHKNSLGLAALIEGVELGLHDAERHLWRVPLPGCERIDGLVRVMHQQRISSITVVRERYF